MYNIRNDENHLSEQISDREWMRKAEVKKKYTHKALFAWEKNRKSAKRKKFRRREGKHWNEMNCSCIFCVIKINVNRHRHSLLCSLVIIILIIMIGQLCIWVFRCRRLMINNWKYFVRIFLSIFTASAVCSAILCRGTTKYFTSLMIFVLHRFVRANKK